MAQEGKLGRNRIAHELSLSQGSVSNILKVWRDGNFDIITLAKPIATEPSLEGQISEKEIELAELRMNIDAEELHLEELKKSAEDFAVIKAEMAAAGIGGPDSAKFSSVIQAFKECGYSPTKIMEVFAEIIDIKDAREDVKRKQKEVEEQREILDRKLEALGFGDMEKLTQTVAALTTLSQYGIDCDKIISISTNLSNYQLRRQQWERKARGDEWNAQGYANDNNGHQQGYNYNYGYSY